MPERDYTSNNSVSWNNGRSKATKDQRAERMWNWRSVQHVNMWLTLLGLLLPILGVKAFPRSAMFAANCDGSSGNACFQPKARALMKTENGSDAAEGTTGHHFFYKALDANCTSIFPDLCHFVDELPIPGTIDGSTNDVLSLGLYVVLHRLHRDLPVSRMYGIGTSEADATTPGPTIMAKRGVATNVQWSNHITEMLYNHRAYSPLSTEPEFGGLAAVMHLHGGETEPESDGHPEAWFTASNETGPAFTKSLYTYSNEQYPATLWYHDHTLGLMQLSKPLGLAGFYIVTDPDGSEAKLGLPTGDYDVPLMIMDKIVMPNGTVYVAHDNDDLPDSFDQLTTVNAMAWPYLEVTKTRYRLRVLSAMSVNPLNLTFIYNDASISGTRKGLDDASNGTVLSFHIIATDGGYVERPIEATTLYVGTGERYDIVINFDIQAEGPAEVFMINLYGNELNEYGLPVERDTGDIMKFYVADEVVTSSELPALMMPYPSYHFNDSYVNRFLTLMDSNVSSLVHRHTLTGRHYAEAATEIVTQGTTEVWHFVNESPDLHTIHLHAVRFQIISRQGLDVNGYQKGTCSLTGEPNKPTCLIEPRREPNPQEMGWKDTLMVGLWEVATIMFTTANQDGQPYPFDPSVEPHYVWHCHINHHVDFEMIRPFLIVPPTYVPHAGENEEREVKRSTDWQDN
eukprot:TRINITY_DN26435_c0_g1_i1.p1 TRINITY_DN26435_c0_g1~~TRINITY_DN26435_c0_g1_i1.p1  ORF type:complete len:683 (+),score=64.31 TRINITY_DN26435_c0_g1_i1:90-2138(+)